MRDKIYTEKIYVVYNNLECCKVKMTMYLVPQYSARYSFGPKRNEEWKIYPSSMNYVIIQCMSKLHHSRKVILTLTATAN